MTLTVFHVIAQLRYGAGRVVADLAFEQARSLGYRVSICVSPDADAHWRTDPVLVAELALKGIEVVTLGDFFHRQPEALYSAARQLRDLRRGAEGQIIVHAHTAMASAVGHWAQPDGLVATCHGWGTGRPADMDLQDSLAYQLCDSVLTYSRHWADRLAQDLAIANPVILQMGLNLDRFLPFPPSASTLPVGPLRMVTVCELTPRKGIDLLLKALPTIWQSQPEAELHIIGHGDAAEDLRQMAAGIDPGLKRITFYGALEAPYERLSGFDLFVLPSRSDNLPVVLLEAMLARLPIVATNVGGIADLLAAAQSGLVVSPESSPAIAEGILTMLERGRKKMLRIGIKGERYGRRHFDSRRAARQMERIYRGALKKRGRRLCSSQPASSIL